MTQTIVQETDFSAVEDAIELWVKTASGLPDSDEGDIGVYWEGFEFGRKRPYAVLSIISDNSPGRACTSKELSGANYVTTFNYAYDWSVQIAIYQDSYDDDGKPIRTTARLYQKNLVDRYQLPQIRSILTNLGIGYSPINDSIRGNALTNVDDDKYIHQAITEFRFNGINTFLNQDSDYFTTIDDPTINLSGE